MADNQKNDTVINRRDLLQRGSAAALGFLALGTSGLHAEELQAPQQTPAPGKKTDTPPPPGQTPLAPPKPGTQGGNATKTETPNKVNASPVGIAVIGLGEQGRKHLASLGVVPGADVRYVCDTYEGIHRRALEAAPKATAITDYRRAIDDKNVQAIYVCTPSHQHREIALAALAAGKHVYCEAPLASSIEDARAIAKAARAVEKKQIFHAGMQQRTNPQHNHVIHFLPDLGKVANTRSTWNKKDSWRRAAATSEREETLNWRLKQATSGGLMNEIGLHQVDVMNWFLKATPVSVTGFGSIQLWRDGRDVQDTVQCLYEYPGGVYLTYGATLANSFEGAYELFQGSDAAIVIRDSRAWLFKEADSRALSWEVYAHREKIGDDVGITLVADASKLLQQGKMPSENRDTDATRGSLYFAGDHFLTAIREKKPSVSGPDEGYQAVVCALKGNEAVNTGGKITFTKDMFDLG